LTNFFCSIENHLGIVLTIAIVLGLILPGLDQLPHVTAVVIIASVIFVSCFKINKEEFLSISIRRSLFFYLLRFVLFPLAVYYLSEVIVPEYAIGLFLLSMMPAGIASPAVTGILNGNVTMALSLVVITSLLAPFVVPGLFYITSAGEVTKDHLYKLFVTLSCVIFIPAVLHLPIRQWSKSRGWLVKNNKAISVLLFGLLMSVVVGIQRKQILDKISEDISVLIAPLVVLCVLYVVFYLAVWIVAKPAGQSERLTLSVCSGVNNNALGIALALENFPAAAFFLVLTVIPWAYGMVVFKKIVA